MTIQTLEYENGHLFTQLANKRWLVDTGAPTSFGAESQLEIAGRSFEIEPSYMGLDSEQLTSLIGTPCCGLLGADILGSFDTIFDGPAGQLELSESELDHPGTQIELDSFMNIPIVEVDCRGKRFRFFFDTGAQISYLQDDLLREFPSLGDMTDFYPGFGEFETPTHQVALEVAGNPLSLRCGQLPDLLGMTLAMADVEGVLGNSFMVDRTVGYFPRRGQLCL